MVRYLLGLWAVLLLPAAGAQMGGDAAVKMLSCLASDPNSKLSASCHSVVQLLPATIQGMF